MKLWGVRLGSCINESVSHDTLPRSSLLRQNIQVNLGKRRCRDKDEIGAEIWNVLFFPPGAWPELAKCWRELTAADMSSFSPDIYQPNHPFLHTMRYLGTIPLQKTGKFGNPMFLRKNYGWFCILGIFLVFTKTVFLGGIMFVRTGNVWNGWFVNNSLWVRQPLVTMVVCHWSDNGKVFKKLT